MAPPRLLRLILLLAATHLAGATGAISAPNPTPVRAPPTRPTATQLPWTTARLRGLEFVDLRDVGTKLGWKPLWNTPGRKLTLSAGEGNGIVFELDGRDCYLNGIRIFLSERVAGARDTLWIAKVDLVKTIAPLLRPADHAAALPAPPRLIVLDAGHGGTDPGKYNLKYRLNEKDMTLDVVLRLKKVLEARGYRIALTRADDTRFSSNPIVDLQRRANFANQAGAELFLSVHFNAVDPKDSHRVTGSETYVLTPQGMLSTSDQEKDDLTDAAFPGNRQDLANAVLGYFLHRQLIDRLQTSDRGYKRARFAVLRFVNCPAALLEAAYLSNDDEAARVAKPEFRQEIAEAIAAGVESYSAALQALRPAAK
ncbi:MAG: N-acetylmuramoyl-L-alanine amidase [Opitutus sp.]|nr:N-acetylmuramoyl-L-alanine amidase [Opitutus sp.]